MVAEAEKNASDDQIPSSGEAVGDGGSDASNLTPFQQGMRKVGLGGLDRFANAFPRVHGIICGIILPVWLLIAISSIFGYWLSVIESHPEIVTNNEQMEIRARAEVLGRIGASLARCSPTICYILLSSGATTLESLLPEPPTNFASSSQSVNSEDLEFALGVEDMIPSNCESVSQISIVEDAACNYTEGLEFMDQCGAQIWNLTGQFLSYVSLRAAPELGSLTFNWNRCEMVLDADSSNSNNGENTHDIVNPLALGENFFVETLDEKSLQGPPTTEVQTALFRRAWEIDQNRLYTKYLSEESTNEGRRFDAFGRSINEATGEEACEENVPAAVWFWFTIMSTIGYGNQSPITRQGRVLVVVAGFMSILAFAGLLATAGYIVAAIWDDALVRFRLRRLTTSPWWASAFWLLVYFLWMLLIGGAYRNWNREFLGDDSLTRATGNWFAFISTTTVGFGDFFLQPEVITARTLVTWPLYMLFGFVWLAAFAGKFTEAVGSLFANKDQDTVVDRLRRTNQNWTDENNGSHSVQQYSENEDDGIGTENMVENNDSRYDYDLSAGTEQKTATD